MEREVMFNDPLGWFPSPFFTNIFPILVFAVFFIDHLIPRLTIVKGKEPAEKSDRGSYAVISIATLIAVLAGVAMRLLNIGTSSGLFQWVGVLIIIAGLAIREWALIKLGRFFSRTVQIETEHKVITVGPYRWIRHPAYTGMILIYAGIIMSIGTWLGALLTFSIVTISLLCRIRVEERTMLNTFGDEYRDYMKQTWLLFPGW
jgi:protein-S-isoprenylcysteine O-methyltransferase Ste14